VLFRELLQSDCIAKLGAVASPVANRSDGGAVGHLELRKPTPDIPDHIRKEL
jgi:hypothetical protein